MLWRSPPGPRVNRWGQGEKCLVKGIFTPARPKDRCGAPVGAPSTTACRLGWGGGCHAVRERALSGCAACCGASPWYAGGGLAQSTGDTWQLLQQVNSHTEAKDGAGRAPRQLAALRSMTNWGLRLQADNMSWEPSFWVARVYGRWVFPTAQEVALSGLLCPGVGVSAIDTPANG